MAGRRFRRPDEAEITAERRTQAKARERDYNPGRGDATAHRSGTAFGESSAPFIAQVLAQATPDHSGSDQASPTTTTAEGTAAYQQTQARGRTLLGPELDVLLIV